jgi:bidirectional [NiFe] hydrogenase diaphorase subunit
MTESCGKCVPCRTGTQQMHGLLDKIAKARGSHKDLALLEQLCEVVQATSLCGLGQTAPNPVLSTLRYFRSEYERKLAAGAGA